MIFAVFLEMKIAGVSPVQFAKELRQEIQFDNVSNGAAALAYYLMLSVFPAAIFLISLLPFLPIPNLQNEIMESLGRVLPPEAASMFEGVVNSVTSKRQGGLLSLGILLTLWSSSAGIYAVMQQLNVTNDVRESRPFWKVRGISILLTAGYATLIPTSFVLILFGGYVRDWIAQNVAQGGWLYLGAARGFDIFRWATTLGLILLSLSLIYHFGPNTKSKWRWITPGSVVGLILFLASTVGFKLYVANFGKFNATYGSIGAVIIMMLWLYISGLVILVGSEVDAVIAKFRAREKEAKVRSSARSAA